MTTNEAMTKHAGTGASALDEWNASQKPVPDPPPVECECAARKALQEFGDDANWFDCQHGHRLVPAWRGPDEDRPERLAFIALSTPCQLMQRMNAQEQQQLDEAFRVRDLAREASNRDLEAKRAAEAEREEYHQMALTAIAERNTAYELRDSRIAEVNSLEAELAEARKALDDRSDASWMRRVDKLTEALADLWLVTPVDTSKASKASAYERAAALLRGEEKS